MNAKIVGCIFGVMAVGAGSAFAASTVNLSTTVEARACSLVAANATTDIVLDFDAANGIPEFSVATFQIECLDFLKGDFTVSQGSDGLQSGNDLIAYDTTIQVGGGGAAITFGSGLHPYDTPQNLDFGTVDNVAVKVQPLINGRAPVGVYADTITVSLSAPS